MEPDAHDILRRLELLEKQHNEALMKILAALESSADGGRVGLQESVRILTAKLNTLTDSVAGLTKVVATHEEERQQIKGAYWACAAISSVISFLSTLLAMKVFVK